MQRMNRNRMGPSFPRAPPARLPMMDFRAKPGFEQKYNILPDISGIREDTEDSYEDYHHDVQFNHSWQSPAVSMGTPMHMGGHKNQRKNNSQEVRMPFNRNSGHLIDGFYNEPNDINPGIQRTITQNHNILARPCDPFAATKNDTTFNNARMDKTFITPKVDMTLYGTKNILPGISKKEITHVESRGKTEDGGFMKRVKSSHALNVHLPRDREPIMAINPKNPIEKPNDDCNYAQEKQAHINIVPERLAEILKEEIQYQNDMKNENVVSRDLRARDNEFEYKVNVQNEKDSTDCTSFGDDDLANPGNLDDAIKMDRREKLGIESSNESNKSFSYEATDNNEIGREGKIYDTFADNVRRESYPDGAINHPDSMMYINQEVEVGFEICDGDGTASIGNCKDSIKDDRYEKLGIESSSESKKSFSYEETEKTESGIKANESYCDDVRGRLCPETAIIRRDSIMGINNEVDVEIRMCGDEKSASAGNVDDSVRVDRREKLGIESSNDSIQSCSYETTEVDEVNAPEIDNGSHLGISRTTSYPEITTVRRDGMICVNHEVEIDYDSCDDKTASEDIIERNQTESHDKGVANDIKIASESVYNMRGNHDNYLSLNERINKSEQMDSEEGKIAHDSSKVDRREKLEIESSNESNQSISYEASDIEVEGNEPCGNEVMKPYPEIITLRRDGMTCVSHEVEIEYEDDENEESYETESEDKSEPNEGERRVPPLGEETYIPDTAFNNTYGKVSESRKEIKELHEITTLNTEGAEDNKQPESYNDVVNGNEENVNDALRICVEKSNAPGYAVHHEPDNAEPEDGPSISINLEETKGGGRSEGNIGDGITMNNTCQSVDSVNVVRSDSMKCVDYEVDSEDGYTGSGSADSIRSGQEQTCSDRLIIGNMNKQSVVAGHNDITANKRPDTTGVRQLSDSNPDEFDKVKREADDIKRSGKDIKHVRDGVKKSFISRTNVSEINEHQDLILRGKVKVTEISENEKMNNISNKKYSKDEKIRLALPQKTSTRVIAIDPETVKRQHRKRKLERDKIGKSVTKPCVQTEHAKTQSSSIDSLPKAIESNTGQITYETDDDIDNISDKILDQTSESYPRKETNEQQLLIKSTKRVTFNDEPKVYNFKSISSTSSNSTVNKNVEDSTDDDTVYDTDDDIDKISNDILDESDGEKQMVPKPNTGDTNFDFTDEKQKGLKGNVTCESILENKENKDKTNDGVLEISKDMVNQERGSKDKSAKMCKGHKVMRVKDDMKLPLKNDIYGKKRRNPFDMISTERKTTHIHETHSKATRDKARNQSCDKNNRVKVTKRHNNENLNNFGHLSEMAIAKKNVVAAGDSEIVSNDITTGKSEVKDFGVKLLRLPKEFVEKCTGQLFRSVAVQTEIREHGLKSTQSNEFEYYASGVYRSEIYKRIMTILETKVGREKADTLMNSKTITDMVENLTRNPEKYGKHFADLLKLREERSFLDLTQLIKDPSKVEHENKPWCLDERMKILALSSGSSYEHKQHDDELSDPDRCQLNDDTQTDVNRNADVGKLDKVEDETRDNKDTQQNKSRRRRFSFKSFFRKFICVCKSKVDHEDI